MAYLERVVADISKQRLVELTRDLVAIPSENPPGNEAEVARYIARTLEGLGLDPIIAEKVAGRPNVIAELRGDKGNPVLLLTGHTDVVPAGTGWSTDPYQPVIRDGKLFGRGACDMKGGLACILHVLELLLEHDVPLSGSLLCAFTVGEESGGIEGAAYVMQEGLISADMGILLEPSDFQLVLAEEGVLWVELITKGTTTHTLNAATASNAVEHMTKLLAALLDERDAILEPRRSGHETPILSVNTVRGGDKPNVIPGECRAMIDIRIPPGCKLALEDVQTRLSCFLDAQHRDHPKLEAEVHYDVIGRPFQQPTDTEIVRILSKCAAQVLRRTPEIVGPVPSMDEDSDAYHYWTKGGIPTVYFGPGKIEQAHSANECIEISQLMEAAEILVNTVFKTLGRESE